MSIRFCEFCGKEIPEHSKVCPFCKKVLEINSVSSNTVDEIFSNSPSGEVSDDTEIFSFSDDDRVPLKPQDNTYEEDYTRTFKIEDDSAPIRDYHKPAEHNYGKNNVHRSTKRVEYSNAPSAKKSKSKGKKGKKNNKDGKRKMPVWLIILIVIILIGAMAFVGYEISSNSKSKEDTTQTTTQSTTTTVVETTQEETTEQETTTTTVADNSQDISSFIGSSYDSVKSEFGTLTSSQEVDSETMVYYYGGLEVDVESDKIVAVTVDFESVSDKDAYCYDEVNYYSDYSDVLSALGEPNENSIGTDENCLGYFCDFLKTKYIKIYFDSNQKVSKLSIYYPS